MSFDALFRDLAGMAIGLASDIDIEYARVSTGTYNPGTSEAVPASTTYSLRGLKESLQGTEFLPGSMVRIGDVKVTIQAPSGWVPVPGDRIAIAGVAHSVIAVCPVWGGDAPVMYEMQVRA